MTEPTSLTLAAIKARDRTEGVLLVPHPPNCPCVWHDRRHLLGLVEGLANAIRPTVEAHRWNIGNSDVIAPCSCTLCAALAALAAGQEVRT